MTGGITKGQIAAGCIGLALLLGIGYWTFLRTDDSNRKKRSKSKKKLQKEAMTKKSKKTTKRKYSDSDSNSSSLPEISDESVVRDFSDSESDSIEVAQRNRKKSKKSKSRSGKNRKSPNKLKIEVLEPKVAEVIPPLNTKRHSPLKVESVLFEKKKKEDQETLAGARSVVVEKTFKLKPIQHVRTEEDEEVQPNYMESTGQRIATEGSDTVRSVSPKKTASSNMLGPDGLPVRGAGLRGSVISSKTRTSMTRQSSKPTLTGDTTGSISNPCMSRKVPYSFDKNCERRALIDSHVNLDLNLLLLTSNTVSGFDSGSVVQFNQKTEGYMIGIATLRFKLKSLPQDGIFMLDFSGDEIFRFVVNGTEISPDDIQWVDNQIQLPGLKKDINTVVVAYGNKLNQIQMNTMRDSFLILRNSDFVARYFPCFLQATILYNFKLEICRPKKLYFIYNNLSKSDRTNSDLSVTLHTRKSKDETGEISFESAGMRKELKFNSFNPEFTELIEGMQLNTESFVQQQYGELKGWPFTDLAFVLANRPLVELGQSKLNHYKKDPSEPDSDPINLQIFGFKEEHSLDFGVEFSSEIINYLESILETKVPFRHVIFLMSDQNTKIESIGNILVLNSLEVSRVEVSPTSLIYFSLTLSLFFARSFFGNLISYETPNEKFIVEGIRGTVALLYLQASKLLNSRLEVFHDRKVEIRDGENGNPLNAAEEEHFERILDDPRADEAIEEDFRRQDITAGFINDSLLSNRSFEGHAEFEAKSINELLFLYLVKLKYELFKIELGASVLPLCNLTRDSSVKTIDSISYHNLLAKFKMYFLLKELKIPSNKFIKAFQVLCKSYKYQTISSKLVIEFIQVNLPRSFKEGGRNTFINDWFRENFEKAGVNIVSATVTNKKNSKTKIGSFEIQQTDPCPSNSGNPIYRKHFTDVVLYGSDYQVLHHIDLEVEDSERFPVEKLHGKMLPTFIDLNYSEIGYFKPNFANDRLESLLTRLIQGDPVEDSKLKFKLFMHLMFERKILEFLDSAFSIIDNEPNYILLEFVLKNAAELCESFFPTKCYKMQDMRLVQEADMIKENYLAKGLERLLAYTEDMDNSIGEQKNLRLIIEYLPHFSHYNFKKARQTLEEIAKKAKVLPNDLFEQLVVSLLDRYFAFYNVELKEKFCLIDHAVSLSEFSAFLRQDALKSRCETIDRRMYSSEEGAHYDEVRRLILRYNRVAATNEDFLAMKNDLEDLCTARVDEAMIVEVFPLNDFITENNSIRRYTKELIDELQRKGMFDYITIIKEQFENLNSLSELKDQIYSEILSGSS